MRDGQIRLLAVDDDPMMRQILIEYLEDTGYDLQVAEGGEQAWALLEPVDSDFDVVLLDRMMPVMDGMAVLDKIKSCDHLAHIPVIMQTAAGSSEQVKKGIEAGAFYYLVKPFAQEVLLAIVEAAVRDALKYQENQQSLANQNLSLGILETGTFRLQTMEEVDALTIALAKACPNSESVVTGLGEILLNAVEHGNLGITYDEKTQLQQTTQLDQEISRRLASLEYGHKYATVMFERLPGEIHITITDQGQGFDWQKYMELDADLACASHGRGIAMAKFLSFDHLEYRGCGNEVLCVIHTQGNDPDDASLITNSTDPSSYTCEESVS